MLDDWVLINNMGVAARKTRTFMWMQSDSLFTA